jgi:hypothetical protein
MRFTKAAERPRTRGQPWPRVVGALALTVLGACGVVVLVTPPRAKSAPSLQTRSNWVLAGALPASRDFPTDWGYGLYGSLRPSRVSDDTAASPWKQGIPRTRYAPGACTSVPKILDHSGAALAAGLSVDRYTRLQAHSAGLMDDDATGQRGELGPNARLNIWIVPDGPLRITNYVDWLSRCGTYQVTNYNQDGRVKSQLTVKTVVDVHAADGTEAAVTRTFSTTVGRYRSATYHVVYFAVRGVIVECTIFMEGADRDLVQQRTAQTLQRLRAL